MSQEKEQNLRRLAESAAKLPAEKCAVLAGIAKGMEISAGIQSRPAEKPKTTRTA